MEIRQAYEEAQSQEHDSSNCSKMQKENTILKKRKRAAQKRNRAVKKIVNPPRLIRFREYRQGFQTPHGLLPMPATLSRNGFLTTDTTQTQ